MKLQRVLQNASTFREVFDFGGREVAHWFPGHMAKGLRQMKASLRKESLNIRPHLLILNKMDLADSSSQQRILRGLKKDGVRNVLFTSCVQHNDENLK
ncbi:hypothetical protein Z043_123770, partial [Scleropages formosus]